LLILGDLVIERQKEPLSLRAMKGSAGSEITRKRQSNRSRRFRQRFRGRNQICDDLVERPARVELP